MRTALRLRLSALVAGLAVAAAPVFAGTCPMCREAAKAMGEDGQRGLNWGILVLVVAAATMFCGLFLAIKRRVHADR
ncbi:MAG: hypothetical protein L6R28_23170 [Planctomycetes bacterium]|nr:hypothetical protein [Planctomycetota bacterium]